MIDVHVIAHTHWDREWYLTREQYRLRLVSLIDGVLERMESEPRFRCFHLDGQTVVLEDYLEVRPEQEPRLRRQVAEGRLLVGPWYVMPDMHLVSGESLVRNLALGNRIAQDFGGVMRVGYMPDPFGHVAQMPQILAGFGLTSAILWRGFGGEKAEYRWEALDGSSVLLLHLPREGYCNALWLPLLPEAERAEAAARVVEHERARSACGTLLLMAGVDHVEPAPDLLDVCDQLGQRPNLSARLSTLPDYVAGVQATLGERQLEVVRGELRAGEDYAPLLPGVLSARVYLKQANARTQTLLERRAEPTAAFAWLLGARYPGGELRYAWRTLLQNHPHDSICGCSVDSVHEENVARFARAEQAAAGIEERALEEIANALAPGPPGAIRILALNCDLHAFDGVVLGMLDVPYAVAEPGRRFDAGRFERPLALHPADSEILAVTDPEGAPVSFQVLSTEDRIVHFMSRYEPPLALRVKRLSIAFSASVPGCGFVAYDARLGAASRPGEPSRSGAARRIENDSLWLELNHDGTLDVHDKTTGRCLRRALRLEDGGDVGDEYNYSPPRADRVVTSGEARVVAAEARHQGPLVNELLAELELPVPAGASTDRVGRRAERVPLRLTLSVRLTAGSPRVDVSLRLTNTAEDHRLRVLVPTGAATVSAARADTAFGVVTRPARRPVPAELAVEAPVSSAPLLSFVDAGDEAAGVSLFSEGLFEYEVSDGRDACVALTLLRSVGWLSRDDLATRRGHAGPGLETPAAQCLGSHAFRFAFRPRAAPPGEAELYREARAFLAPPVLHAPAGREGRLPSRHCFLQASCEPAGEVVLSALKRAEEPGSLIVRVFNPGDRPASVRLGLSGKGSAGFRTDLREKRLAALALTEGHAVATLGPRRIATVELAPEPAGQGPGADP